jgi:hypothetical protein
MILLLAKYRRRVAFLLLLVADLSFMQLAEARAGGLSPAAFSVPAVAGSPAAFSLPGTFSLPGALSSSPAFSSSFPGGGESVEGEAGPHRPGAAAGPSHRLVSVKHSRGGGPNQPEMTSFKSINAKDLVNTFSGDFNYNIPLMDVGGYPINLYYTGGVSMEQEAGWVGLGWNLNPGTVTRNMRGIPDDFNGKDTLVQTQNVKPNNTWGMVTNADVEGIGIKALPASVGFGLSLGISFNNYLGPALDLGVKGEIGVQVANVVGSEKNPISLGGKLSIDADLSSRNGLTLSPNLGLTAGIFTNDREFTAGLGLSTSYNSRIGVKALQISEQVHMYNYSAEQSPLGQVALAYFNGIPTQHSSTINFARPSYSPSIRVPLMNSATSGHFQLGGGFAGIYVSGEIEAYSQTSTIDPARVIQAKPMVGYLYYEQGVNNPNAVMDFTRFNDKEVTPNTPVISAPQYSYDVFTIQGEGTGGSIRAYRNDLGFVRDNATGSQDKSSGVGVDIGIPGHYGANFNEIKTPTSIGEWSTGNKLHGAIPFRAPQADTGSLENVYFRNPGETTVLDGNAYTNIGGTDLVRFALSGDAHTPNIEPVLQRFSPAGIPTTTVNPVITHASPLRKRRSQVVDFLTADQATLVGLDKRIRSYNNQTILAPAVDTLLYTSIARDTLYRKGHHLSQIDVTEPNGKRYVYGIPVYNTRQEDFTFTVCGSTLSTPASSDKVGYSGQEINPFMNPAILGTCNRDGYAQVTQTPAYSHSFLLTALLSPDYVDVTGDGITDDDLGSAVKFNYTMLTDNTGKALSHHWRTPYDQGMANFNAGARSQVKDDKGIISYGEREAWYLHSVESKTLIALFVLQDRSDAKGVTDSSGGISSTDSSSRCLKEIDLYSKSDLKQHGLSGAKPIKTVHFSYSYTLCAGTPDNGSGGGKLTLDSVYFTYNGQNRANKDKYYFSYVDSAGGGNETMFGNPGYLFNASDRWGTYKPAGLNPGVMKNSDFPYTPQQQLGSPSPKAALDTNAGAWSLKRILLPSGGQIEVGYEGDDYAYVQNRRAMDLLTIAGFGHTPSGFSNRLYDLPGGGVIIENNYLFVNVPVACHSTNDITQLYLQGVSQLAVKLAVNMPAGLEYVTSYAMIDSSQGPGTGYGLVDSTQLWFKLSEVGGVGPLSLSAEEFLRQQLPGEAFPGYDVSQSAGLEQIADALVGMLDALKGAFSDPVSFLRSRGLSQTVQLNQSFARLNDPAGFKYGGGHRVKFVKLKDNWKAMTGQFSSVYTQTYDYTTTETFNGTTRTISSGVASYEPAVGSDENPFQTIVQVANSLPLGPTSYGAIEMPVLDAFFPAPMVGYSQVTVRSVSSAPAGTGQKSNSGIGRQVTEFYTAKDYPVSYSNTGLDPSTDLEAHDGSSTNFFYKYAFDSRALSQGFLVATNDMHGKLKAQSSYADNDTTLRVNYTQNFYRNTGANGLNEQFNFVSSGQGGLITPGNLGIDVELMTDTRQFLVSSNSLEIQGQVEFFPFIPPWLPFIWPVVGNSDNNYRAVTTTKVVSYHSVLDSVVVYDKGSTVSTKNLVYDGETGEVLVTRTNNEYNQAVYSTSYPAWWAYSGMGPAYRNIGICFTGLSFSNGVLTAGTMNPAYMESGDEYLVKAKVGTNICPSPSGPLAKLWLLDLNKNNAPFPLSAPNYVFIDSAGNLYTNNSSDTLKIVRSGKRNQLDVKLATVTSLVSPIVTSGSNQVLSLGSSSNVVGATATDFSEKWQNDIDAFPTFTLVNNPSTCTSVLTPQCNGPLLEPAINPYRKGLLGDFRPSRSLVFYGSRNDSNITVATNLAQNGFLANFTPYWSFNTSNQLVPNTTNTLWLENNRTTRYNAKGLELETKNALNIYTAAQYGYGKELPVAVVQNASQGQAMYEGFEDYAYTATVDPSSAFTCSKRYIDLSGYGNIVNPADSLGFGAHTGSFALQVANGVQATGAIPVAPSFLNNYHLFLKPDTTKVLNNPGGNITGISIFPTYGGDGGSLQAPAIESGMSFGNGSSMTLSTAILDTAQYNPAGNSTHFEHDFTMNTAQWMQITTPGTYTITMGVQDGGSGPGSVGNTSMSLTITDANGNFVTSPTGPNAIDGTGASTTATVFLCVGFYQVSCFLDNEWTFDELGDDPPGAGHSELWEYTINSLSGTYKTLSTQNGCIFKDPIPATDTMMNPVFTLMPGTKVEVSAWVHEPCASPPCNQTTFTNEHIGFSFPGSSTPSMTMHPSGPIIEGWQRIDTAITVPSNATSASLILGNDGSQKVYFDDIRIHPFNADMVSYVYDPVSLRLVAELDQNNYASFFEYDEDGTLVRKKAETQRGIQTIQETRSIKQRNIITFQP